MVFHAPIGLPPGGGRFVLNVRFTTKIPTPIPLVLPRHMCYPLGMTIFENATYLAHMPYGWHPSDDSDWQAVGHSSRFVYRGPDGFVYKTHPGDYQNLEEFENYMRFKDSELPEGVRIPEFDYYNFDNTAVTVSVTEYVEGKPTWCVCSDLYTMDHEADCVAGKAYDLNDLFGTYDLGGDNCLIDSDGIMWVVDFGC